MQNWNNGSPASPRRGASARLPAREEITTPEYYPLSLNALVNACNQKSNRDPAVNFDEATVEQALHSLRDKGLLLSITGAGSRVQKYAHRISEKLNLGRPELAILCELMLRGPQTLGELRTARRAHASVRRSGSGAIRD